MALGVRILSNNLSGDTANVTFLPLSGGTIDLGTQTIPFNYLNPNYFGTYQIQVPLYGYTYELVINESTVTGQSFSFVSKMVETNNYGESISYFGDFTAQVIDLGIDDTGWYINDVYPLTNSGYTYYFQNQNTCNLQWAVFTDAAGNVIEDYYADCNCNYDYDVNAGKLTYFSDYYNGIYKYFNGSNVYTLTADSSYQSIYFYNSWDGVMSNNNFVIAKYDDNTGVYTNYLVDGQDLTELSNFNGSDYNVDFYTYFDGSFALEITYANSGSNYETIKIYDGSNGNLLQTLDFSTGDTYNNYNLQFYGDNKIVATLWNSSDSNVDWFVFQYDGNTDVLNTRTHTRGSNYPEFQINSNTNFFPNNGGSEAFVLTLYNTPSYNGLGTNVNYCDIIYMLSGDTDFTTYTFQNSSGSTKTIQPYFLTSNIAQTVCDTGNGYVSTMSLTHTGVTYTSSNVTVSGGGNQGYTDRYNVGDGFVTVVYTNFYAGCTLVHTKGDGSFGGLVSGITFNVGSYPQNQGSLFQLINYSGLTYTIDDTSDLFLTSNTLTLSANTYNVYTPQNQFREDYLKVSAMLTFEPSTRKANILTPTGYTSTHILPGTSDYDIIMGNDKFMFTYLDSSGNTNINLYDFNFNLLNSEVTPYTTWWSTYACGDRFNVIINENNRHYIYLVSENTITSTTLVDTGNYDYTMNDYIWWD
jgi:hypothetical protein